MDRNKPSQLNRICFGPVSNRRSAERIDWSWRLKAVNIQDPFDKAFSVCWRKLFCRQTMKIKSFFKFYMKGLSSSLTFFLENWNFSLSLWLKSLRFCYTALPQRYLHTHAHTHAHTHPCTHKHTSSVSLALSQSITHTTNSLSLFFPRSCYRKLTLTPSKQASTSTPSSCPLSLSPLKIHAHAHTRYCASQPFSLSTSTLSLLHFERVLPFFLSQTLTYIPTHSLTQTN